MQVILITYAPTSRRCTPPIVAWDARCPHGRHLDWCARRAPV